MIKVTIHYATQEDYNEIYAGPEEFSDRATELVYDDDTNSITGIFPNSDDWDAALELVRFIADEARREDPDRPRTTGLDLELTYEKRTVISDTFSPA